MYKRLYQVCFVLALSCLIVFICMAVGCTADQANRGADAVGAIQAATTQPYVTVPASVAGPYGELVLAIASPVLALLAAFFKSQQSSAQAHLDTAKAATGTNNNASATAALVNNLEATAVPAPVAMTPAVRSAK